ncbi:MAG: FAD-dependent oxidoreductase [Rhodospirillaceae bacterium]|nr:MAG: FAD-dependent oxidoreductase [Rhodospirillaceae bacterium]
MIRNLPARWDFEADVVSIGSGIGGLAAAITAHDHGASALVLERSEQVGGVTALSMGEVWVAGNHHALALGVEDSPESGFRYLKRLSMDYGNDVAILNKVVHARAALKYFEEKIGLKMCVIRDCPDYYYGHSNDAVAEGRMLEALPFPAETLGEWQSRTRVSQMPYGLTHHDMFERGGVANMMKWDFGLMSERLTKDERCLGAGLVAYFVKGALDRGIPMHTGANAEELIGDGARVVGVRVTKNGQDLFVKANRGVVIAVSSYERNQNYNKTLGQQLELGSMVFSTINGANFRLAGPVGARIAKVPDITSLGFIVPGEEDEEGKPLWRSALQVIGQPHTIVVNRKGRRFGNEAFYRQFYYMIDIIDGGNQTHPNFPCWAIIDSQAHEKYPFASVMPDQDWPKGLGATANSIAELAGKIGVDARGLEATIASFNTHAEKGEDPEFHRGTHTWSAWMCGDPFQKPNPNLGPLVKPPFYAVELHRMGGTAIAATGVVTDQHSRAVGWDEKPIEGLYVAGNSVARMETGAVMQSGISNARGMTHGYLAGLHAAGKPSDMLQKEIERLGL